ncbi:MAG TPA: hypothetical protein VKA95_04115 [Nitrososphaeraceae archaeon]|nr:hypothetical protein [Nitrososphaeraceae archaeon]
MNTKLTIGTIAIAALVLGLSTVATNHADAKSLTTQTCEKKNEGETSGGCQGNRESSPTWEECFERHAGNSINSKVKDSGCE